MDERSITAQVLRYLLKNRFHSKAEMARALGIQQRTLEKVFAQLEIAKGSTIALSKALEYCLKYNVPLEPIFHDMVQADNVENSSGEGEAAYARLKIEKPQHLTSDGERIFLSMRHFLCQVSAQVCPKCKTWCNPWDGKHDVGQLDCCIGHMACEIVNATMEFYMQGDKSS